MMLNVAKPDDWDRNVAIILAHGAGQGINSPFMRFFHEAMPKRGFLSVQFNFEYMDRGRKMPDPQPKMQALYRQVVEEVAETHRPRGSWSEGSPWVGAWLLTSRPTRMR
jgi:predicted alpha/beta-hydrolase family hydrolase